MFVYQMVIVPARHNVSEGHRLAGFPGPWRNSQRLAVAIGQFADDRWHAAPVPPGWPQWARPTDNATAGATVRLAMALSQGSSPAARALLTVGTGLRDGGHDWSHR
jgi:hypothetical protein